jgi:hypothetical protein
MQTAIRAALPFLMALALTACGGGGGSAGVSNSSGNSSGTGGTGGTSTSSDGSWLSFTPNPIALSGYEGESIPFKVTATSSRTFAKPFNIAIVDTSGTITTDVQISALNEMSYQASLSTSPKLPAGVTQVNLEVRLCEDAPLTCSKPLPGSPWKLPLKVDVKSATEAAKRMSLSVQSLDVVANRGSSAVVQFDGTFNGNLSGQPAYLGVFDKGNLVTAQVAGSPENFKVTLTTAATLKAGEYTTNLELRLCRDSASVCSSPVSGSPWAIPLKLTVKNPVGLTPLSSVPGVDAWSNYQGSASHTGFVDASFDVSNFSARFSLPANGSPQSRSTAAVDNGNVFMAYSEIFAPATQGEAELRSIKETDGTIAWRASLGTVESVNPPAVGNGFVYVTTTTSQRDTLWVFNQQDGSLASKTSRGMSSAGYYSSTVFGSNVYSLGKPYYGYDVRKFSSASLMDLWTQRIPSSYFQDNPYSPAVDARNIYIYANGKLAALDIGSGLLNWETADVDDVSTGAKSVALSGNTAIVMGERIAAFDLYNYQHIRLWSVENKFAGALAIGNDMVYAVSGTSGALEARSIADGKLQWTSESMSLGGFKSLVVTRNLAFVSGTTKTQAIDLATRKVVWTYARGGELSVSSNGVLYILEPNGYLSAINLQ